MLLKLFLLVIGYFILIRLRVLYKIVKGGLRFIPFNKTLKWIVIICTTYLFYFLSYVFINEIPFLPLFQYAVGNWLVVEVFNVFRINIYTPISYHSIIWIGHKLDKLHFRIAEKIGLAIVMIDFLLICSLEIIIISLSISYDYVYTTDIIFDRQIVTAYILLTFGIGGYAVLTGSGLTILQMANHQDVTWGNKNINYTAKTGILVFFIVFLSLGLFIKWTMAKNDFFGLLNTMGYEEENRIIRTFSDMESDIKNDLKTARSVPQGNKKIIDSNTPDEIFDGYDDYMDNVNEIFNQDPVAGLYALKDVAGELSGQGKYHKLEVEMLRVDDILRSMDKKYDYSYLDKNDSEIEGLFDDLQLFLVESISRQRVRSKKALELYRELIEEDEQDIREKNSIDYLYGKRRLYEVGMYHLFSLIGQYPQDAWTVKNDLLQLIERNKARKFNRNINAEWISDPPVLSDGDCGLNYISSMQYEIILAQYYDKDTTISFVIPNGIIDLCKDVANQLKSVADDALYRDSLRNMLFPKEIMPRLIDKNLFVSLDAYLQEIPLQYLLGDSDLRSITQIPSFSSLAGEKEVLGIRKMVSLSVSKPNYVKDQTSEIYFDSLYFSDIEVQEITKVSETYLDTAVFLTNVSETWVKTNTEFYDLIHFAAHSTQDGLYLNRDDLNDGKLTVPEIRELGFNGQTIFLSSCESAAGQYEYGEGISSIAKAFLDAGAGGVIASLWALNDEKVSMLVSSFYDRYFDRGDLSSSLYIAQKEFQSPYAMFKYPFIYITY